MSRLALEQLGAWSAHDTRRRERARMQSAELLAAALAAAAGEALRFLQCSLVIVDAHVAAWSEPLPRGVRRRGRSTRGRRSRALTALAALAPRPTAHGPRIDATEDHTT